MGYLTKMKNQELHVYLYIILVLLLSDAKYITVKDDLKFISGCAALNASFTMSTSYEGPLRILNWCRTDITGDITITMPNDTLCDVIPTRHYDLTKYSFKCSSKQHNYSVTIKEVQNEDIGINWTVKISTATEILTSNTVQLELCDSAASNQEEKDGLLYIMMAVPIVVFVAVFVTIVIVKFIFKKDLTSCKKDQGSPSTVNRTIGKERIEVNELINFIGAKETGKQSLEGEAGTGSTKTYYLDIQTFSNQEVNQKLI